MIVGLYVRLTEVYRDIKCRGCEANAAKYH